MNLTAYDVAVTSKSVRHVVRPRKPGMQGPGNFVCNRQYGDHIEPRPGRDREPISRVCKRCTGRRDITDYRVRTPEGRNQR